MSKINNVFLFLYASLLFEPIDFILTFKSLGSQIYRHILKEYTVIFNPHNSSGRNGFDGDHFL